MASWLESVSDWAGEIGGEVKTAATDYIKDEIADKLGKKAEPTTAARADDVAKQPAAQPPAAVGDNGKGGTVAQVPIQQAPVVIPSWALPVGLGMGGLLVLGVLVSLVRR